MSEILYQIKHLKKFYEKKQVLNLSDFEVLEGEVIGITGRNGSGKSTLLRLLAYLEFPNDGEVYYKGFSKPSLELRREIAMVLCEPYLLKRSIKENLIYGLKVRGQQYSQKQVFEVLELVGLEPKKFINRFYNELSSGEIQRIGLACKLILSPKVLLLDEPTNSLDSEGMFKIAEAIRYACEFFGATVLVASHDRDWLEGIISREMRLHVGKMIDPKTTIYFSRHWKRDERENLFYDFLDGQILYVQDSANISRKIGIGICVSLIKIFYTKTPDAFFGNIISIELLDDEVNIYIQIGIEKIKARMDIKEYLEEKPFVNQKVWVRIGISKDS